MVDISEKTPTLRTATAVATLKVSPQTLERVRLEDLPKGNALEVARVAAIQAAKNTSQIIPFCHPLPLEHVDVKFALADAEIVVTCSVKAVHKTGVEMEALTAATVAALTLYDMLKMVDDSMEIVNVRLVEKRGGKADHRKRLETPLRAAVLVLSDSISAGSNEDVSGRLIEKRLRTEGFEIADYKIMADDELLISGTLAHYADDLKLDLVLTTGGTGFGPRDHTPEATARVIEREIPGIPEALRAYGQTRTPYSMLSRGKAGIRGNTVMVNLPGSQSGVTDSLNALFPGLLHSFNMVQGGGHPPDSTKEEA